MPDFLRIAVSVSTPLSLLGLLVAIGYLAYARRLKYEETKLQTLPAGERAKQIDIYLTRYGIDGRDLPPADKLALIRDEMEKRDRRSREYVVGTTVAFVVCFAVAAISFLTYRDRPDPLAYQKANGTIDQPRDGQAVNAQFDAVGTAQNVRNGTVYLWVTVEINGRIWPKEGSMTVNTNSWKQSVREDGHPNQFGLSLWAASPDANVQLRAWLEHGQQTGDYPELHSLPGMKRLEQVQGLHLAANR